MKPNDVTSSTYNNFGAKNKNIDPKFEAGVHVGILKYKIIFAKGYNLNWSEEVFLIKKIKNTVCGQK